MPSRRRSRESALQMLYQWEVGGAAPDKVVADYLEHFTGERGAPVDRFAERLFRSAAANAPELDTLVRRHARRWAPERMSLVVRNLLRLAVGELRTADTPASVVIDEAVEIGRRFAGDNTTAFLNGVLDAVRRDLARASRADAAE